MLTGRQRELNVYTAILGKQLASTQYQVLPHVRENGGGGGLCKVHLCKEAECDYCKYDYCNTTQMTCSYVILS